MPKKIQEKNERGKILNQWNFSQIPQYKRTKSWYLWLGIISAGLFIYALSSLNLLFAFFIILADIILVFANNNKLSNIKISIAEDGLEVGKNFYPFNDFEKFWLVYEPPETKKLYFEFKNKFRPFLIILLENQNPAKIRQTLSKYLTEDLEKENESLGEQMEKWLKI
ncbi:MAG: Uncharacterized protein Athens101410_99 [Parcubacteria group bacterium Athens1014_10]|nr:MAG: Uncharacterized protein Athens101410_99 [Parcubacteria group bacterium Athens1014_10]TSD05931.1 MAG: Uncharacterized protein Athens071412_213 [Parcubacteria group bacterium Athens0714_12]